MVFASVVAPAPAASVGTGLNQWNWSGANVTIGPSSYSYSNMAGFVQAVVNANGCSLVVDGSYGGATSWATAVFQNNIIGYNNGGVMTPTMLLFTQTASHPQFGSRLSYTGYIDGYGTKHYGYYAGYTGASDTRLGWNAFAGQWLFSQTPHSNPNALVPAVPSHTIGAVGPCS